MVRPGLLPVLAGMMLAGCATPSQRVASALSGYGVPQRQAQCMGDQLVSRLNNDQLRRLAAIARAGTDRNRRIDLGALARQFQHPEDAVIGAEVLTVGLRCSLR